MAKMMSLISLTFLLFCVNAQEPRPDASRPIVSDEEFECGLVALEPIKFEVSVWNSREKKFINNLNYVDFEVLVNDRVQELDYFVKPSIGDEKLINNYVFGMVLGDFYRPGWYSLKVKMKPSKAHFNVVIKAPKRIYIDY